MQVDPVDERLKTYAVNIIEDEEHALKKILQEIALYGLSKSVF
jgi:hypothetical protein